MAEMMRQVPLNVDKSRDLYMEHPQHYGVRQCYINVYRAITDNFDKAAAGEWKVAYGYYAMSNYPNLLLRHCFILDEDDHVIDPTIFAQKCTDANHIYYVMYVFSSFDDYLRTVKEENYCPGLVGYLHPYEMEAHGWARDHNCFLCG